MIIKENDWTNFSLNKNKSGYISFGVAPLINDYLSSNFSDWDISLKLIDKKIKPQKKLSQYRIMGTEALVLIITTTGGLIYITILIKMKNSFLVA